MTVLQGGRAALARLASGRHLNEVATLGTRAFGVAAGIASSAVTARALGPHDRGVYFYVIATAGVLAQFGHFGTSSANTYFAAVRPELSRRLLTWTVVLAAGSCCLFLGMLVAAEHWPPLRSLVPSVGSEWLAPLAGAVLLLAMLGPILAGLQKFWLLNGVQLAYQCAVLVGFVGVAATTPSVEHFLAVASVGAVVTVVVQALLVLRLTKPSPGAVLKISEWLRYGARAYGVLILGGLISRVGVFFLKSQAAPNELGYYSVALQIFDGLTLIPASLALIMLPAILREQRLTWVDCRRELLRMLLLMGGTAAVAGVLMPSLVAIVFGPKFAPAVLPIMWLLPAAVMISLVTVASQFLAALGFPWITLANWIVALCLAGLGAVLWIGRLGAVGAAMATLLAYGGLAVLMILTARRMLRQRASA